MSQTKRITVPQPFPMDVTNRPSAPPKVIELNKLPLHVPTESDISVPRCSSCKRVFSDAEKAMPYKQCERCRARGREREREKKERKRVVLLDLFGTARSSSPAGERDEPPKQKKKRGEKRKRETADEVLALFPAAKKARQDAEAETGMEKEYQTEQQCLEALDAARAKGGKVQFDGAFAVVRDTSVSHDRRVELVRRTVNLHIKVGELVDDATKATQASKTYTCMCEGAVVSTPSNADASSSKGKLSSWFRNGTKSSIAAIASGSVKRTVVRDPKTGVVTSVYIDQPQPADTHTAASAKSACGGFITIWSRDYVDDKNDERAKVGIVGEEIGIIVMHM